MATASGLKLIYIQWIVLILGIQLVPTGHTQEVQPNVTKGPLNDKPPPGDDSVLTTTDTLATGLSNEETTLVTGHSNDETYHVQTTSAFQDFEETKLVQTTASSKDFEDTNPDNDVIKTTISDRTDIQTSDTSLTHLTTPSTITNTTDGSKQQQPGDQMTNAASDTISTITTSTTQKPAKDNEEITSRGVDLQTTTDSFVNTDITDVVQEQSTNKGDDQNEASSSAPSSTANFNPDGEENDDLDEEFMTTLKSHSTTMVTETNPVATQESTTVVSPLSSPETPQTENVETSTNTDAFTEENVKMKDEELLILTTVAMEIEETTTVAMELEETTHAAKSGSSDTVTTLDMSKEDMATSTSIDETSDGHVYDFEDTTIEPSATPSNVEQTTSLDVAANGKPDVKIPSSTPASGSQSGTSGTTKAEPEVDYILTTTATNEGSKYDVTTADYRDSIVETTEMKEGSGKGEAQVTSYMESSDFTTVVYSDIKDEKEKDIITSTMDYFDFTTSIYDDIKDEGSGDVEDKKPDEMKSSTVDNESYTTIIISLEEDSSDMDMSTKDYESYTSMIISLDKDSGETDMSTLDYDSDSTSEQHEMTTIEPILATDYKLDKGTPNPSPTEFETTEYESSGEVDDLYTTGNIDRVTKEEQKQDTSTVSHEDNETTDYYSSGELGDMFTTLISHFDTTSEESSDVKYTITTHIPSADMTTDTLESSGEIHRDSITTDTAKSDETTDSESSGEIDIFSTDKPIYHVTTETDKYNISDDFTTMPLESSGDIAGSITTDVFDDFPSINTGVLTDSSSITTDIFALTTDFESLLTTTLPMLDTTFRGGGDDMFSTDLPTTGYMFDVTEDTSGDLDESTSVTDEASGDIDIETTAFEMEYTTDSGLSHRTEFMTDFYTPFVDHVTTVQPGSISTMESMYSTESSGEFSGDTGDMLSTAEPVFETTAEIEASGDLDEYFSTVVYDTTSEDDELSGEFITSTSSQRPFSTYRLTTIQEDSFTTDEFDFTSMPYYETTPEEVDYSGEIEATSELPVFTSTAVYTTEFEEDSSGEIHYTTELFELTDFSSVTMETSGDDEFTVDGTEPVISTTMVPTTMDFSGDLDYTTDIYEGTDLMTEESSGYLDLTTDFISSIYSSVEPTTDSVTDFSGDFDFTTDQSDGTVFATAESSGEIDYTTDESLLFSTEEDGSGELDYTTELPEYTSYEDTTRITIDVDTTPEFSGEEIDFSSRVYFDTTESEFSGEEFITMTYPVQETTDDAMSDVTTREIIYETTEFESSGEEFDITTTTDSFMQNTTQFQDTTEYDSSGESELTTDYIRYTSEPEIIGPVTADIGLADETTFVEDISTAIGDVQTTIGNVTTDSALSTEPLHEQTTQFPIQTTKSEFDLTTNIPTEKTTYSVTTSALKQTSFAIDPELTTVEQESITTESIDIRTTNSQLVSTTQQPVPDITTSQTTSQTTGRDTPTPTTAQSTTPFETTSERETTTRLTTLSDTTADDATTSVVIATTSTPETVTLVGDFKITEGMEYEDELEDINSPAYAVANQTFDNIITNIYTQSALRQQFVDVNSFSFRQGSVIVEFLLLLQGDFSLDQVGEIFREGILATEYTIDPDSIAFAVVDDSLTTTPASTTTTDSDEKDKETIIKYRVPSWAIGVIIGAGVLIVFLLLLGIVWCCTTSSKETAYYTVPHSNSSYTESMNGEFTLQSKDNHQLFGTYNVLDETTPTNGPAYEHSTPTLNQPKPAFYDEKPLSPQRKSRYSASANKRASAAANGGHLYFEEGESPIAMKRKSNGPQADNVMEEIHMDDFYIYDAGTGERRRRQQQQNGGNVGVPNANGTIDRTHSYSRKNGSTMSTFKEPEWRTVTPSEITVLNYPNNGKTKTYYDVELGIWTTKF